MFDVVYPEKLSGRELDEYLARGYYRIGQSLFTDSIVIMDGHLYKVYWLRMDLKKIKQSKKIKKLFRNNNDLQVEVRPFHLSLEILELHELYKSSIKFNGPESLREYLLEDVLDSIFDTRIIEIRDGDRLVAAGFYDVGKESTAAIINFYHPDYKQRGLGIYLFFLEIVQSRQAGKAWFYPGYVADGHPKFDYKLLPGVSAAEMYDYDLEDWVPFTWDVMRQRVPTI